MVYLYLLAIVRKIRIVFVQELLWFIWSICILTTYLFKYSYKNCYGLSDKHGIYPYKFAYSYKNCYGLSDLMLYRDFSSILYSYKNCYGLSFDDYQARAEAREYSYKNCYGLSMRIIVSIGVL